MKTRIFSINNTLKIKAVFTRMMLFICCLFLISQDVLSQPPVGVLKYPKRYSYLQCAVAHFDYTTDGYPSYEPTSGYKNDEEVLVITDTYIYRSRIVSQDVKNLVNEQIHKKEKTFTFKIPFVKKRFTYSFLIWKRKYHLPDGDGILDGVGNLHVVDYVYRYIYNLKAVFYLKRKDHEKLIVFI